MSIQQTHYCQLGHYSLSRTCRSADKEILICVVGHEEDLCLDRIEMSEVIQPLIAAVFEYRNRKWIQIEKRSLLL